MDLYYELYTYDNMKNDSVRVFEKYASLLNYKIKTPNEKYRIRIDDNKDVPEYK